MRSVIPKTSFKVAFGLLVGVLAMAQVTPTEAQPYVYQPAPDYYHNDTASGTFLGGVMGAITGAVIGAGVGAVTGNLVGRSKDRADEQRAAAGAAAVGQMNAQAAATAVTNYDLLQIDRK